MPSFTVTGRPVPFKRHAGVGRRAYNQPEYSAWRDAIAWRAREARVQMLSGYVFVMVEVFVSHHPGDADNYAKGALDACLEALAMNPFHPDTHRHLLRAYAELGMQEDAARELRIITVLDPSDIKSRLILERLQQ